LILAYATGELIGKDDTKAVHWFKKAAYQGDLRAQYSLGLMFIEGRGVPKDVTEGYAWWSLSAERELEIAKNTLSELKQIISPAGRDMGEHRYQKQRQELSQK